MSNSLICRCGSTNVEESTTMVWASNGSGQVPIDTVTCTDCGRHGKPEIFTADFHERQRKWADDFNILNKMAKKARKKDGPDPSVFENYVAKE